MTLSRSILENHEEQSCPDRLEQEGLTRVERRDVMERNVRCGLEKKNALREMSAYSRLPTAHICPAYS